MHSSKNLDNKAFVYNTLVFTNNLHVANIESFPHEGARWNVETRNGIALWAALCFGQQAMYAGDVSIYFASRDVQSPRDSETKFFVITSDSLGKDNFSFRIGNASAQPHLLFEQFGKEVDEKRKLMHNSFTIGELMQDRVQEIDKLVEGKGKVVHVEIDALVATCYTVLNVKRKATDNALLVRMKEDLIAVARAVEDKCRMLQPRS